MCGVASRTPPTQSRTWDGEAALQDRVQRGKRKNRKDNENAQEPGGIIWVRGEK